MQSSFRWREANCLRNGSAERTVLSLSAGQGLPDRTCQVTLCEPSGHFIFLLKRQAGRKWWKPNA
jgi:hypothetical protein